MIAQQEFIGPWFCRRRKNLRMTADQTIFNASIDIGDTTSLQNYAMLNFTIHYDTIMRNSGERTNIGVGERDIFSDNRWPTHHAVDKLDILFQNHFAFKVRNLINIHRIRDRSLDRTKHNPVRLQHIPHLTGVDPVAADDMWPYKIALLDEILDGIGNLKLSALRWADSVDSLKDMVIKKVDTDEREIADRLTRFLDQTVNTQFLIVQVTEFAHWLARRIRQQGYAELLWIGDPLQKDLRLIRAGRIAKLLDCRFQAFSDKIVSQKHQKTIISQKGLSDFDCVSQPQWLLLANISHSNS